MGAGINYIGLGHNLPIEDPCLMAESLAERLGVNVEVVAKQWYEYDAANHHIKSLDHPRVILHHRSYPQKQAHYFLRFSAIQYEFQLLKNQLSSDEINTLTYEDCYSKDLLSNSAFGFGLYIFSEDSGELSPYWEVDIFPHHIVFDFSKGFCMWDDLVQALESDSEEEKRRLKEHRSMIFQAVKPFGCSRCLMVSNEGVTESLAHEDLYQDPQSYLSYIERKAYVKQDIWDEVTIPKIMEACKHIRYADYMTQPLKLDEKSILSIVYDNFDGMEAILK